MAKKITAKVKLQLPAGSANPSPPVGPALGQHGVNIMEFCKAFNARTMEQKGTIIPALITIYADRSFTFITKTPPASVLLVKAASIAKGSGEPNKNKVGKVTAADRGNRQTQDGGHVGQRSGSRLPHHLRHRPQHGH